MATEKSRTLIAEIVGPSAACAILADNNTAASAAHARMARHSKSTSLMWGASKRHVADGFRLNSEIPPVVVVAPTYRSIAKPMFCRGWRASYLISIIRSST